MPDFESGAFNRSAISPAFVYNYLQTRLPSVSVTYDINYDIASSRVWLRASTSLPHDVAPGAGIGLWDGLPKKVR
jgi:hypothetical protein